MKKLFSLIVIPILVISFSVNAAKIIKTENDGSSTHTTVECDSGKWITVTCYTNLGGSRSCQAGGGIIYKSLNEAVQDKCN